MIELHISTKLYPTEDRENIISLFNLFYDFSNVKINEENSEHVRIIEASAEGRKSLNFLFQQIRRQRTVEAVRKQVLRRMDLNHQKVTFYLHKQAAVVGQIHFCELAGESPLGPIIVTVSTEDPVWFVDWLTPHTENGQIVHEIPPYLKPHRGTWLR